MLKTAAFIMLASLLSACALSGKEYSVNAYNAQGKKLGKSFEIDSNKSGIPVARDTLCKTNPGATIRVYNNLTGLEVKEYSPYSCRRR